VTSTLGPKGQPADVVETFLFTDIEGSTRLAHELGSAWPEVLGHHHRIVRREIALRRGTEVHTAGDSFFCTFAVASDAVEAAVAVQRALAAHDWSPHPRLRVRMGIHTGPAVLFAEDYAGLHVHAAARVEAAAAGDQILVSEATRDACGDAAPGIRYLDLGLHWLKDLPTQLRLFQVLAVGLHREFPPVRSLAILRNNIPAPVSSFIGREAMLTEAHDLLDRSRIVTFLGAGGSGKTRLALRIATERLHRYTDGVWLVEFERADDDQGALTSLANALHVDEQPNRSLADTVGDHLRSRELLLVFDNCEHLVDGVARMVEGLTRVGPGIHVLATSREPLGIEGEQRFIVTPLSIDGDDPTQSEAVRLLVDRVQRVQPEFELVGSELGRAAIAICRRLDGLPLALELAAASATLFSLPEIDERLDQRFELLTRGSRGARDRQRTLWGTIDWSYNLLSSEAQDLLRRLSVFASEFDVSTVSGVFADARLPAAVLADLVDKSLVARTVAGRLRMLESIRAFARECLAERKETDSVEEQHARWFAERVDVMLPPGDLDSLGQLELIYDDLVLALRWFLEHDRTRALGMVLPMQYLWRRSGRWTEGRRLTEQTLAATTDIRGLLRVKVLDLGAELARYQSDLDSAREMVSEMIEIRREIGFGDDGSELLQLATIARLNGDLMAAESLAVQCLEGLGADNLNVATMARTQLTEIARQRGDLERAWTIGSDALAGARAIGRDELVVYCLNQLGTVARHRGEAEVARRLHSEALVAAREYNDTAPVPYILYCKATIELDAGELAAAAATLSESIALGRELDARADLVESVEAVARLACAGGQTASAVRLLAAAESARSALAFPRPPADVAEHDGLIDELQRAEGGLAFAAEWTAGRGVALNSAVELALDVMTSVTEAE